MSLFIGRKPSDNKPLLHVTSGDEPLTELQGNPIESTLFHSDIPYLAIQDVIEITQFRLLKTKPNKVPAGTYTHWYVPVLNQKVKDYMRNGNLMAGTIVKRKETGIEWDGISRTKYGKTYNVFIGNFSGTSFAKGTEPYPENRVGSMSRSWPPLNAYRNSQISKHSDMGIGVSNDQLGYWDIQPPLEIKTTSISGWPRVVQTSNVAKSESRELYANYRPSEGLEFEQLSKRVVIFQDTVENPPNIITWRPNEGANDNCKLMVYVFNIKYNSQKNVEHTRPDIAEGIKISREDLVIGNLSMKNGMLISDPNISLRGVLNNSAVSDKKDFYQNVINKLSLEELTNYPIIYAEGHVSNDKSSWRVYDSYSNSNLLLVHRVLDPTASLDFSADEIKYSGSKDEFLIASKSRKYTPYILGGDAAFTAIYPAQTKNFAQLKQGATFKRFSIGFASDWRKVLNPEDCGSYVKEEVLQRIKLPPGSTGKKYLTAHLSPIYIHGEASSTIGGKTSKLQTSIDSFYGWADLHLRNFENDPGSSIEELKRTHTLGTINYSVIKDVALTSSDGWWPFSSTGNKMQAVKIRYSARVNFVTSELELVAKYELTNAALRVSEYSGRTTYYNKLGETEVTYKIPEVRFGFYIVGASD